MLRALFVVSVVTLIGLAAFAQKSEPDYAADLPRIPPTEKTNALSTFIVKPGYRLQQVAAEPLLTSPVAVAWDENSRLYVVEMRGYSEDRNDSLSRITILDDTDGDGIYDTSIIFADKLLWPTAIACWDGGVFVADAPNIYYFKDTTGDGKADVKQTVFTGFSTSNVQGLLNTFLWTLDNRIHGSASSTGGNIVRPDVKDAKPVSVNGRDFDFDPRLLDLRPTSGGAQHGMSFDDWGRKFVSSNSDHIQQVLYEDRYIGRNPALLAPGPRVSIASDGPQAEVYRQSPVEPWRILRTKLRVSGAVPGVVEGGGRAAGYFTGATGVTIYRGDATSELNGLAFVADVGSNLVHRKKLTAQGVQLRADRIDNESEFVASKDIWFRPVQFTNGPDGCLTIIDMYRETIEHPASLPPVIKKHFDLTSGRDRGRLYRVVAENSTPRALPKLGSLSTVELVELLDHPNAWHRETASRLLFQRQDATAVDALTKRTTPLGRMHALYALDGLKALKPTHILTALSDESPRVREHAVRLAERFRDSVEVADKLVTLADDADPFVRYQLAFTLGDFPSEKSRSALAQIARKDSGDRWVRLAILSSLREGATDVFASLLADPMYRASATGRQFLGESIAMIARQGGKVDAISTVLKSLPESESTLILTLVRSYSESQGANPSSLLGADSAILRQLVANAGVTAMDEKQTVANRVDAIRSLRLAPLADVRDKLTALLDTRQPLDVQLATLNVLDRMGNVDVASMIADSWASLSPRAKGAAAEVMLARPERIGVLLNAVEKKTLQPTDLDATQIKRVLAVKDPAVRAKAESLFAGLKTSRRADVIEKYRPALDMKGDLAKGKAIFTKNCAACHKLEGVGNEIGPSLSAMKNRGAEAILVNVLDPNAEVNPQFVNYLCNLDDGRSVTGLIIAETATSITFGRGEAQRDVIPRGKIESLQSTGLSIMPEGLEKDIDVQAMADLIAYLMQVP